MTYEELQDFFRSQDYRVIIAADAQPRTHKRDNGEMKTKIAAGGVAVAIDPIAKASDALYITRGRTPEDKEVLDKNSTIRFEEASGNYTLKRLFFTPEDTHDYYAGFSNQSLWPLCHVAFEKPIFDEKWFQGYMRVNEKYAQAIKQGLDGKTFIWVNDYQLAMVPKLLNKPKNTTIALFWHIPWPTWEVFRILPFKREILESLLLCDFLAFHRGYHVRNFMKTVERELGARIEEETGKVYLNGNVTTVTNLPLGIDIDVIRSLVEQTEQETLLTKLVKSMLGLKEEKKAEDRVTPLFDKFKEYKVALGVDRLDYTKGLKMRLAALDRFLELNKNYIGKMVYLGIMAPSREGIPSYEVLRKEVKKMVTEINKKYATSEWKPIHIINSTFTRDDVVNFYKKADLCLVTPLDDGMNLVSKEFVIASATAEDPGMIVLSQFAGSAIDLNEALIINPYNVEEVAAAIKRGLEMPVKEKRERMQHMVETLDEKNVYVWARDFFRLASLASRENRGLEQ